MTGRDAAVRASTLALLFLVSVALAIAAADLRNGADRIGLDPSWAIDLENQWLQGRVSGRDFFFTYGPLAQWITLVSRLWRHSASPLDGWMWTPLTGQVVRYLVVTLIVAAQPRLTVRRAIGVFAIMWFVPAPWFTARQLLVVLSVSALGRALAAPWRAAIGWGVAAALAGFAGQLFTFEVAVFTLGAWVGLLGIALALARLRPDRVTRAPLGPGAAAAIATWLLLQGGLEGVFRATSTTYRPLGYFFESWQIAKGYNLTMGTPWMGEVRHPRLAELVLLGLVVALVALVWRAVRRDDDRVEIFSIAGLGVAALLVMKGAIVRADAQHIKGALAPAWLCFALTATHARLSRPWRALGAVATVLAFGAFGIDTKAVENLVDAKQPSIVRKLGRALDVDPIDPSALGAATLRPQLRREQALVYPLGNHVVIAAGRPSLAPTLQAYAAVTLPLQQRFVDELERHRGRLDVVYAQDGSRDNWVIDGVPSLTRSPVIFRYLLEHFELAGGAAPRGLHVLTPRGTPRPLVARPIADGPCALLEVDLQFDYGPLAALGRPLGAVLEVETERETMRVRVVPIEAGRPFSTLVFLGGEQKISHRLFGTGLLRGALVKRAQLVPQAASRFSVAPRSMEVRALRCVVPASDALWGPGPVNLLPLTGIGVDPAALVRLESRDLFMHGGRAIELTTSGATPSMCLRATVGWHADVQKPKTEARDGIAFVVTLLDRKGGEVGAPTRVSLMVDQEDAELEVPLPAATPLTARLAVDPLYRDTWDWGLWKRLRVEPCGSR